jgi:hypothetical protein
MQVHLFSWASALALLETNYSLRKKKGKIEASCDNDTHGVDVYSMRRI